MKISFEDFLINLYILLQKLYDILVYRYIWTSSVWWRIGFRIFTVAFERLFQVRSGKSKWMPRRVRQLSPQGQSPPQGLEIGETQCDYSKKPMMSPNRRGDRSDRKKLVFHIIIKKSCIFYKHHVNINYYCCWLVA